MHVVLCHQLLVSIGIHTLPLPNMFSKPPGVTPNGNTPGSVPNALERVRSVARNAETDDGAALQFSERSPASMRWISRSRRAGTTSPRTTKVRTMGKYGSIAAVSAARDMPASRAYSDCAAALVARGRSGLSAISGASLGQDDMEEPKVEGGGRAHREGPVDEPWAFRRHDHVAGVKVAMAQPVAGRQAIDQGEDARGDVLRKLAVVELATLSIYSRRERTSGGGGVL